MELGRVQQAYSRMSAPYIGLFGSGEHEVAEDLDLIRRHLAGRFGKVVDLHCGPGHLTELLASQGAIVSGFDLVHEFAAFAKKTHAGATFGTCSITALPLPDGSVAGALCWYSLIHFAPDEIGSALREVRRVLGLGAPVVIGFFVGDTLEPFDHAVVTAYRWPIDALASHLQAEGPKEVERLQRPQEGDRRAHGVLVARAV